ncbi:SEC-C metal-binding domain-containing protein [Salinicoccus sp. HZC-1]|uniref:SEC-C metal-binding domain-containing protein n=1 Tax=Salinicoccus sp. HZC-1 TaxID=3385497 RepID=UPI00398BAABB
MASMNEYLNVYNMNDLKQMARTISLKHFSKLKKDELIEAIIEKQKETETAAYAYCYIDDESFKNWKAAANNDRKAPYQLEEVFGLYIMGYAFEEKDKEDQYFITDTVKNLFDAVDTEENKEKRITVQRKLNLIRASLHLYGIVSFEQLIHLFKKYYDMNMSVEEITQFLEESPYDITLDQENQEIVIDDMNDDQYQMVRKLQGARPYYEPEFAKFIKFSNPNFIDESEHHARLKEWIAKNADVSEEQYHNVYISLLQLIMKGAKQDEIIQYLMSLGVEFKDVDDQRAFFDNIAGIVNNTRHFKFRGHKESELKSKTIVREVKVGRNDPCPCGSGRKYKKCCGA